jgi:hypothetical protein
MKQSLDETAGSVILHVALIPHDVIGSLTESEIHVSRDGPFCGERNYLPLKVFCDFSAIL